MADFKKAFDYVMGNEGGYANHPSDTGGETYKGISRNNWPSWAGWPRVDQVKKQAGSDINKLNNLLANDGLLQQQVKDFYRVNFWNIISLDKVENQGIATEVFDQGVNMSPDKAARHLQEALNLTNRNRKLYKDTDVDGDVGNETIQLTNQHPKPIELLYTLNLLQGEHYIKIMRKNPTQEVFLPSWFSRTK